MCVHVCSDGCLCQKMGEGRPGRLPPTLAEGERGGLGVKAPARRKSRPLAPSICIYMRHHVRL